MKPVKKLQQRQTEIDQKVVVEIEYICPVKGLVKQKVEGLRYKPLTTSSPKYTVEGMIDDTVPSCEQ